MTMTMTMPMLIKKLMTPRALPLHLAVLVATSVLATACGGNAMDEAFDLQEQAVTTLETHKDAPKEAGEALEKLSIDRADAIANLTELKKDLRKHPERSLKFAERYGAQAITIKERELALRKSHPKLFEDATVKRLWPKFE